MAATLQASAVMVENNYIEFPSNVALVGGLDNYVTTRLASFNNASVTAAINNLSTVYLAKNGTAVAASKATLDGAGNNIVNTYAKKTDTIAAASVATRAWEDRNGYRIDDWYLRINGSSDSVSVGYASVSGATKTAEKDLRNQEIVSYIHDIYLTGDNRVLGITKGDGTNFSLGLAGLLTTAERVKLDSVEVGAQNFRAKSITFQFDDYNNVTDPGFYYIDNYPNTGKAWAHTPAGEAGATHYMLVYSSRTDPTVTGAVTFQFLFRYASDSYSTVAHPIFFRSIWPNNNWYPKWSKFTPTVVDFA